jgi:outer membrane immunogenic protein
MKKIVIGALLAGVASSAFAADLPTSKAPPAPYIPPPVFSWTGFYVGLNGGYGWGSVNGGTGVFGNPSGGLFGLTYGANWQTGQFVLGIEGDWDWAGIGNNHTLDAFGSFAKSNLDDFTTVRGRLGMAFDRSLIYVTGGYAGGEVNAKLLDAPAGDFVERNNWHNGFAVGAGIEYAFTPNITGKAEYLFSQLGQTHFVTPDYTASPRLDISMIRAGINYKW